MGQAPSTEKQMNFEDMQGAILNSQVCIITTMGETECYIRGTTSVRDEEDVVNAHLSKNLGITIAVYGKNCVDATVSKKCLQLNALGFKNVVPYSGGIFEWLLLQDMYGADNFPTTTPCIDLLRYKSTPVMPRPASADELILQN
jgi:hypothetical protein